MGLSLFAGSIAGPGNTAGTGSAARLWEPRSFDIGGGDAYVSTGLPDSASGGATLWRITAAGEVSALGPPFAGGEIAIDRSRGLLYTTGMAAGAIWFTTGSVSTVPNPSPGAMSVASDGTLFFVDDRPTSASGGPVEVKILVRDPPVPTLPPNCPGFGLICTPFLRQPVFLAGGSSVGGERDGTGGGATFPPITAIAAESIFTALVSSGLTVRRIARTGNVLTIAGDATSPGFVDGAGGAARFARITAMAVRADGLAFVYDAPNRALRTVTALGVVTTVKRDVPPIRRMAFDTQGVLRFTLPHAYGWLDERGAIQILAGQLEPDDAVTGVPPGYGLAVDSRGAVYTTLLASDGTVSLRKYDASGRIVGWGPFGGDLVLARDGSFPNGSLAIDDADNVYEVLSNRGTSQSTAYRITPSGSVQVVFTYPSPSLAGTVSPDGTPYFADLWNFSVRAFRNGAFVEIGTVPRSRVVQAIAADNDGRVVLLASGVGVNVVQQGRPFTTIAGDGGKTGHVDATGSAAAFLSPSAIALDREGNVFVRDYDTIRKVTPGGAVTTVAGTYGQLGTRLGALPGTLGRSLAQPALPSGAPAPAERIAVGRDGVLYVQADHALLRVRLR